MHRHLNRIISSNIPLFNQESYVGHNERVRRVFLIGLELFADLSRRCMRNLMGKDDQGISQQLQATTTKGINQGVERQV